MRRKSAMLEGWGAARNWRCRAAKVLVSSQTSRPSARLRTCCRCGLDNSTGNRSRNPHSCGEFRTIRVSMVGLLGESGPSIPDSTQEPATVHLLYFSPESRSLPEVGARSLLISLLALVGAGPDQP